MIRFVRNVADRALAAFTEWFCSKGGVWQTTLATLVVVAVEVSNRRLDPHAFLLMAVLTVYSAITQPALAYSGTVSARRMEALESQNAELLNRIDQLLEAKAP